MGEGDGEHTVVVLEAARGGEHPAAVAERAAALLVRGALGVYALGAAAALHGDYVAPPPGIFDQLVAAFGTTGAAFVGVTFLIAACNPGSDAVSIGASCVAAIGGIAAASIAGPGAATDLAGDPGIPDEGDEPAGPVAPSCGNSFPPDTPVLTAAGKAVPISKLKTGEKIQSANTASGKNETQTVDAVLVNHDTDLYNLAVHTAHGNVVIHTTSNHPFWEDTAHAWIDAGKLRTGDHLHTANGTEAVVVGGVTPTNTDGWMWDLTVSNDHDFYVEAGNTPVLVHNCDETIPNVALGTQDNGLGKFATDNGYTVFTDMTRDDALAKVQDVANYHDETTIHVRLDGFKMTDGSAGATPGQLFDDAVTQGQGEDWYTTQKEMSYLERANRLGNLPTSRLQFYMGGNNVTSEVLQQSQYLGG